MTDTIRRIVDALSGRGLSGWQVRESRRTSHQSFLALSESECRRTAETRSWIVSIHKKRGDALGLSSFKLTEADSSALNARIDDAVFAAGLVSNQAFDLPEPGGPLPEVDIDDAGVGPAMAAGFEDRVRAAVDRERAVRLSSAEIFADRLETRIVNHRGVDVSQAETSLHLELILLAKNGDRENEFIDRYTRRLSRDFDIEGEVRQSAELAREATKAGLPKTGRFPVLLSDEPLDHLFGPIVARASARLKYNRMVEASPGDRVLDEGPGDPVTVWSNPLISGASGSFRFDGYGMPAKAACLVERSVLKNHVADKRYADYLGIAPTGELGNVEVGAGTSPYGELLASALSRDLPVYQLLAFSAFEPNPITGAFSAEIRAGYEISASGKRPIKGGSVSGVLQRDLARARLSKERTQRESVLAPTGVFFDSLTIAGE